MLGKGDLQAFRSSLRAIYRELKALPPEAGIPEKVFEELSCMDFVIQRSEAQDKMKDSRWKKNAGQ